ncbi:unnamed protein product [Cylicocyclus nassatus]|uniref:Uncharacterized protein n=1 Tax=Cylicocyclus nassatus TaxID=53992 RepID=A0AA36MHZ6_CYLNA|nr:unnamed protein product [Cylicocyclus nassatus]
MVTNTGVKEYRLQDLVNERYNDESPIVYTKYDGYEGDIGYLGDINNWQEVTFNNLNGASTSFYVVYRKDGSTWEGEDRGYIAIKDGQPAEKPEYWNAYWDSGGEIYYGGWDESTYVPSQYPGRSYSCYMSNGNKGVGNTYSYIRIEFTGIPDFTIYINSYAESSYDYTVAGQLDTAPYGGIDSYDNRPISELSSNFGTGGAKAHTSGKQAAPDNAFTSNYWTEVKYPNDGGFHFIYVVYRKDGSVDRDYDRGFVLIADDGHPLFNTPSSQYPQDEIWYWTTTGNKINFPSNWTVDGYGISVVSNQEDPTQSGKWILKFNDVVAAIAYEAFAYYTLNNNNTLTKIWIPQSCSFIGEFAFDNQTNLSEVYIGNDDSNLNKDISLDRFVFFRCSNLRNVYLEGYNSGSFDEPNIFMNCTAGGASSYGCAICCTDNNLCHQIIDEYTEYNYDGTGSNYYAQQHPVRCTGVTGGAVGFTNVDNNYDDFEPHDKDVLILEDNPVDYKIQQQIRLGGNCYFKWKRLSPDEYVEYHKSCEDKDVDYFMFTDDVKDGEVERDGWKLIKGIDLPKDLVDYFNSDNRLIINWVDGENTKTMKKVFPILKYLKDDDIIINIDDDALIPREFIKNRYDEFIKTGLPITSCNNPKWHYVKKELGVWSCGAGSIFRKKMLRGYEEFMNDKLIHCYNDDWCYTTLLWLNGYKFRPCTSYSMQNGSIDKNSTKLKKYNDIEPMGKTHQYVDHSNMYDLLDERIKQMFGVSFDKAFNAFGNRHDCVMVYGKSGVNSEEMTCGDHLEIEYVIASLKKYCSSWCGRIFIVGSEPPKEIKDDVIHIPCDDPYTHCKDANIIHKIRDLLDVVVGFKDRLSKYKEQSKSLSNPVEKPKSRIEQLKEDITNGRVVKMPSPNGLGTMFGLRIVKETYLDSLLSEIDSLKNTCIALKDEIAELEKRPTLLTDVAETPLKEEKKVRKTVKKTDGKTTRLMKKFTGTVNGKSFDNEEDFNAAAAEAIKSNDGNLTISSYYSYVEDTETKEEDVKEDEKDVILTKEDYFLSADAKPKCYNGTLDYNFPEILADKLSKASNTDEIRTSVNGKIGYLGKREKEVSAESKDIQNEIEHLQDRLYKVDADLKDILAQRRYYNSIIDVLDGDTPEDCEKCEEKKCNCGKPVNGEFKSLFDFLRDLGFWTFRF